jgi:hypothetical protein
MPNRPIHVDVSTPVGARYGAYKANSQIRLVSILGIAGGTGGFSGGIVPDLLDPPFHLAHRSVGHGALPVAAAANFWNQGLDGWQQSLRRLAGDHRYRRSLATDPVTAAWHACAEWALRLLAGFLAGFGVGYLSHIALDFGTPRCLPLIT